MTTAALNASPSASPLGDAPFPSLRDRLWWALLEDQGPVGGRGDVTSRALTPMRKTARAILLAKQAGVMAAGDVIPLVFELADALNAVESEARTRVLLHKSDGDGVRAEEVVAEITGNARSVLLGERTMLNLVGKMMGVATLTSRYVQAISGTKARILDTRKTTPLWRDLEKRAVVCGGGMNHRIGLHDMLLIKDNHLALWGARDVAGAVAEAKARYPGLPVEVEVEDLEGFKNACTWGQPDFILLDNFEPGQMQRAVEWSEQYFSDCRGRPLLEASGGITLENVRAYAETGVDRISIGALTHSALWLDLSLNIDLTYS